MQGKIALEEHFAIEATLGDSQVFGAHVWKDLGHRLLDIQDTRLREMDKHGIEMMILSLNAPAVQAIHDVKRAIAVARQANDVLAAEVRKRPGRFAAFAALPMQDPDAAIAELTRCIKELGLVGALVNGFSQIGTPDNVTYYDLPQYRPFWRAVEALDVPFYLHPRNPLPSWTKLYEGHAWLLGPNWAFAAETAVHALRLIGSGLFDECPTTENRARPSWRRHSGLSLAHRQPQRLDEGAAQIRRQARRRALFPQAFPSHHLGQLPHAGAGQCHDRDGRRPRDVFGRLAVRGRRRRRAVVRQGRDQRSRPRPRSAAPTRSSCSS